MSKSTKQAVPAQVQLQPQPRVITLIGNTISIMQQVTVLARAGYFPDPNMPVEFFGPSGTMQIILLPGTPDAHYANAAAVALEEAAQREQAQWDRAVEEAAKRQIEAAVRVEIEAKRAALIAEQRAALAALEAELAVTQ